LKTREKNKGYLHLRGLRKTSKDKEIKPSRSKKDLKGVEDLKGLFQILVANALWHHIAQALLLVFLVVGEVALKPDYLRVSFKSQDMRTNTI
jgi:hypothetical protein